MGYAEETTFDMKHLREQFDFATELPVIHDPSACSEGNGAILGPTQDLSKPYWRLRGPNQWPSDELVPGFRKVYTELGRLLTRQVLNNH